MNRPGIQYVVETDPLANRVMVDGPNGQEASDLWVIRKQNLKVRGDPKSAEILDYYYIYNDVIFQAPRMNSILKYRMLTMAVAMSLMRSSLQLPLG